ncbi:hypothetical protein CYMTET_21711 [Cymbomonas tetramitiformis]|uniref:EF-hand domain-containing protein n=1 Tax=Cymbomonas tetramitiformis TaxID=36881 RepID=A0AAE0L310_9CHLO|nr:hypothetical protein CYMTET_21711 [Cymbomonas tetramitiformis]
MWCSAYRPVPTIGDQRHEAGADSPMPAPRADEQHGGLPVHDAATPQAAHTPLPSRLGRPTTVTARVAVSANGSPPGGVEASTPTMSSLVSVSNGFPSSNDASGGAVSHTRVRMLSLKQMKELMTEVYASKAKSDARSTSSGTVMETMQQHLYTFLNQKFGLRALVLEWAGSILSAVDRFTTSDSEVASFGKILSGTIDEGFHLKQHQLSETVVELLRAYLKSKHHYRRDNEIAAMLQKRLTGFVYEEEWIDIVRYMYNHQDSVILIQRIKGLAESWAVRDDPAGRRGVAASPVKGGSTSPSPRKGPAAGAKRAQRKVPFNDLLQVFLFHNLDCHEQNLSQLVAATREVDLSGTGLLNHEQFQQFCENVHPAMTLRDIQDLADSLDTHGTGTITSSCAITALSAELSRGAGKG